MTTISAHNTEIIDRLFLELSQFTQAKSKKELDLEDDLRRLRAAVKPFARIVETTSGRIPHEKLSGADWHALVKAFRENGSDA